MTAGAIRLVRNTFVERETRRRALAAASRRRGAGEVSDVRMNWNRAVCKDKARRCGSDVSDREARARRID